MPFSSLNRDINIDLLTYVLWSNIRTTLVHEKEGRLTKGRLLAAALNELADKKQATTYIQLDDESVNVELVYLQTIEMNIFKGAVVNHCLLLVAIVKSRELEFKRKSLYRHFTTVELPSQMVKLTQSVSSKFAEFSLFTVV